MPCRAGLCRNSEAPASLTAIGACRNLDVANRNIAANGDCTGNTSYLVAVRDDICLHRVAAIGRLSRCYPVQSPSCHVGQGVPARGLASHGHECLLRYCSTSFSVPIRRQSPCACGMVLADRSRTGERLIPVSSAWATSVAPRGRHISGCSAPPHLPACANACPYWGGDLIFIGRRHSCFACEPIDLR